MRQAGSFERVKQAWEDAREPATYESRLKKAPARDQFVHSGSTRGARPWDVATLPDGTEIPDLIPRKRPGFLRRPPTPSGIWSLFAAPGPIGDSQFWSFFVAGLMAAATTPIFLTSGGAPVSPWFAFGPIAPLSLGMVATALLWLAKAPPRAPDGTCGVSTFTFVPKRYS